MKKFVTVLAALGMSASILGACSSSNSSTQATPNKKETLTVMAAQGWAFQPEFDLAKKFEKKTGIHVDYQIVPMDQYYNVLKTKLNSNQGPDIFMGEAGKSNLQLQLNVQKNAVDLSNEAWVKQEDPLSIDQTKLNGKVYGLEIWDINNGWVVNYNKDIFQKLGLSVPKTYDEFKSVCQKIKDAGITPIYEAASDGWHHVLWFPELGPRFEQVTPGLTEQLNNNKTKFADNSTMLTDLTQLNEMYKQGFFGSNALSNSYNDRDKAMASGKYAMIVAPTTEPTAIQKNYPNTKADTFGFFVMPLADNQILNVNPAQPSKFIYKGSKHIKEAKEFFSYLTTNENLQYQLDKNENYSSLNFKGLKNKYTPAQDAFFKANTNRGVVFQASIKYLNAQWTDIGKDIVSMWSGQEQPKDVLKNIDQKRADMAQAAQDSAWK